jgi:hypothetical protein
MRVCVVHGHHWVTGLPLEQGARCWRRCWRWRAAYGVQHSVIIALPLGHPRGNLRELNFLSGQLSSPRRPALGRPLGRAGEVESEESPTGRVPTRTPHTSRKGASPAARMATMGTGLAPSRYPSEPLAPLAPHQKRQTSCKAPLSAPPARCTLARAQPRGFNGGLIVLELAYRCHTATATRPDLTRRFSQMAQQP